MTSLIDFVHVSCGYGGLPAIENVHISIAAGEFLGVVGPSGSGKTTLLRALLGTVKPLHGTVTRKEGVRLAYVPQVETVDWNFPVTVGEVVLMTRTKRPWPGAAKDEKTQVDALLERLGLEGLAKRHIRELSGGQQQRVFLARALMQRPDLLVLDEPTSGVDVRTRHEILHVLTDLNEEGIGIVLTTHDLNGLAAHLPRLVCFNRAVIADGPPLAVLRPSFLERTYGAPMEVLEHGGMPVVVDGNLSEFSRRLKAKSAS